MLWNSKLAHVYVSTNLFFFLLPTFRLVTFHRSFQFIYFLPITRISLNLVVHLRVPVILEAALGDDVFPAVVCFFCCYLLCQMEPTEVEVAALDVVNVGWSCSWSCDDVQLSNALYHGNSDQKNKQFPWLWLKPTRPLLVNYISFPRCAL